MNKSIEDIWQTDNKVDEGKLEHYLHRKESESHDLLQQLLNKYHANNKWVGYGALLSFCILPMVGMYFLAITMGLTFASVYLLSKKQIQELSTINKSVSCRQYLIDYRAFLNQAKARYGNIYQVIYPLLFATVLIEFFISTTGTYFISEFINEGANSYFGAPIGIWLFSLVSTLIIAVSAKAIYLKEVSLFYGQELRKLDDLISDLSALEA